MIDNKWEKEIEQEEKLLRDEFYYKDDIRRNILIHYRETIYSNVLEKMKIDFETKYLGKNCFEISWKGQKYKLERKNISESDYYEFIKILQRYSFTYEVKIMIYNPTLTYILRTYLQTIYEQTNEYKLKNIYK
jgi:hypothetical protein